MNIVSKGLFSGAALIMAAGLSTAASAQQPLDIVVRPVTTVIGAPFAIVGGILAPAPVGTYNPEPAKRAAVAYTSYDWAVVRPGVLKQTGPRHVNPANADYSRPIVLRRGSVVPGYVNTAPAANISLAGLLPNYQYDFFVSPQNRVVFVNPTTRQVERIVR